MIPTDYHLHSTHSADGHGSIREMCEAALAAGLSEIGFAEHIDFARDDPHYGYLDDAAYSEAIAEARGAYAGRLAVRKGVEFDFRSAYGEEVGEVLASMDFDFLMGSVHAAAGRQIWRLHDDPPSEADLREILDACLKCHQCAEICPVGIETVQVLRRGRALLKGPGMRSFLTKLIFRLILPRRRLYNMLMRLARWAQKLTPGRPGSLRHLPLVFEGRRNVPCLARRPALPALPRRSGEGTRVAFFTGCLLNYVYPGTAANALRLLVESGCEVLVPQEQLCCGLAALYTGDEKAAVRLARRNAVIFSSCEPEYVVTACATCATMLKQEYPRIAGTDWSAGARVMEITEFLALRGFVPDKREGIRGEGGHELVALHDNMVRFQPGDHGFLRWFLRWFLQWFLRWLFRWILWWILRCTWRFDCRSRCGCCILSGAIRWWCRRWRRGSR